MYDFMKLSDKCVLPRHGYRHAHKKKKFSLMKAKSVISTWSMNNHFQETIYWEHCRIAPWHEVWLTLKCVS